MSRRGRCDVAVDPGDPALPVAGSGSLSHLKRSRNARRRAIVLLVVHLLVAAHVAHYVVAGRTLSPVEPSESMYTLELGELNAGFVFFVTALAATLVFGRYFCGWGCHVVALQDVCAWLMKRAGIRPRPFRSRFLAFAPLAVALYMFVWPSVKRVIFDGAPFAGFSDHFMTDSFWRTFPGPLFAVLTLATCGFAVVYFLGSKGFCTYGCPYGALFGAVDRLSPGRIVVDDGCEQCGHCTATCTSNVRVHQEVRDFGRVVDPGCMKCMDCVSVCPKNALSFGWARPALLDATRARARRTFDLGLVEEFAAAAICAVAFLVFRGLYDGPPLLMSIGLGALTAFVALRTVHLLRRSRLRLQGVELKSAGRVTSAGRVFVAMSLLWLAFATHSGVVQWHRAWGRFHLNRTEATYAQVMSGGTQPDSPRHRDAARRSFEHFRRADRVSVFPTLEIVRGLAWGHLLRGETVDAERQLRRAIALAPSVPRMHDDLIDLLASRGQLAESADALSDKIARAGEAPGDRCRLGASLAEQGDAPQAIVQLLLCVAASPESFEAQYNLGGLLRRDGRPDEAIGPLRTASELRPTDPDAQVELGLALAAVGSRDDAIDCLRRAVELAPDRPESRHYLPGLIRSLENSK